MLGSQFGRRKKCQVHHVCFLNMDLIMMHKMAYVECFMVKNVCKPIFWKESAIMTTFQHISIMLGNFEIVTIW